MAFGYRQGEEGIKKNHAVKARRSEKKRVFMKKMASLCLDGAEEDRSERVEEWRSGEVEEWKSGGVKEWRS